MATQTEIADWLGVSDRTIRQMMRDGILDGKKGRNGYDLKACVQQYIHHLKYKAKSNTDDEGGSLGINSDLHDARLAKLKADDKEIDVLRKLGQIAPIDMILQLTADQGAKVAGILDSIPGKIARAMPELPKSRLAIITEEITKARNEATEPIDLEPYLSTCFTYGDSGGMETEPL